VTRFRGAAFRVAPLWVGVLALVGVFALDEVGVFALDEVGVFALVVVVGVSALDARPLTCGLFRLGELERVDGAESLELFSFLTERGSLEADPVPAPAVLVMVGFRDGVLRDAGGIAGDLGMSLCDRVWPF
jgi:hypothetical protein